MSPSNLSFSLASPFFHSPHLLSNVLFLSSVTNHHRQLFFILSITGIGCWAVNFYIRSSRSFCSFSNSAEAQRVSKNSEIVQESSSSTSRLESVEDLTAISQQIFKFPCRRSAPISSTVYVDGRDGSFLSPRLITLADEERVAKNKKEVLKWKRAYDERVRMEQVSWERAIKVAHRPATSTPPSEVMFFSGPVT